MMRFASLLLTSAAVLLVGCQTASQQEETSPQPGVWARKDGQRIAGNPDLESRARADESECRTEASVDGSPATMAACMDARGYRIIPLPPDGDFVPL
jgi:hypothetical protein